MSVRVRKLAKELDRSVGEVLGVLHALGLSRYRNPDDMLPPDAVERVRKGLRRGVRPVPLPEPEVRVEARPKAPVRAEEDEMARLPDRKSVV